MPQDLPTLALSVLNVSRNTLSIHLRFMNLAISRLRWLSIPDAVPEMPMLQPHCDVPDVPPPLSPAACSSAIATRAVGVYQSA